MEIIDQTEMKYLILGLAERNIPFTLRSFFNGIQVMCDSWDAICHDGSYGGKDGLIEVMGLPDCEGDVIGHLTADEVLKMID